MNFDDLLEFVQLKATIMKSLGKVKTFKSAAALSDGRNHQSKPHQRTPPPHSPPSKVACTFCSAKHQVEECEKLLAMSLEQRYEILSKHAFCFKCLDNTHKFRDCTAPDPYCDRCKRTGHQTILHGVNHIVNKIREAETKAKKEKEEQEKKTKAADQARGASGTKPSNANEEETIR